MARRSKTLSHTSFAIKANGRSHANRHAMEINYGQGYLR
jgi:hypothetical protein